MVVSVLSSSGLLKGEGGVYDSLLQATENINPAVKREKMNVRYIFIICIRKTILINKGSIKKFIYRKNIYVNFFTEVDAV
jgi:hypothetical protein